MKPFSAGRLKPPPDLRSFGVVRRIVIRCGQRYQSTDSTQRGRVRRGSLFPFLLEWKFLGVVLPSPLILTTIHEEGPNIRPPLYWMMDIHSGVTVFGTAWPTGESTLRAVQISF